MGKKNSLTVVMFGSGGVGKTALILRYCHGEFLETYDPTIEETYSHTFDHNGNIIPVEIRDTAGQEEFVALREQYIRTGHSYVLVFSLDNRASFREVQEIQKKILRVKDKAPGEVPIVICGNKCDLPDDQKIVTEEEIKAFATEEKVKYQFCSAKDNINVTEAFEDLISHTANELGDVFAKKSACICS
eukprot:Awhi_evm1s14053